MNKNNNQNKMMIYHNKMINNNHNNNYYHYNQLMIIKYNKLCKNIKKIFSLWIHNFNKMIIKSIQY